MRNPMARVVRRIRPTTVPAKRYGGPVPDDAGDQIFCTRCGMLCPPGRVPGKHYVNGHLACEACGRNIAECCEGETT